MKIDVLTITAIVFILGAFISSLGISDGLSSTEAEPPPALHQGIALP